MTRNVLVVDDKELMRDSVGGTLQRAGFAVTTAPDAAAALEMIPKRRPDAVVSDLKMPGMTGIELLEKIRGIDDQVPVLLMTAFGTIETAVRAMKLGAFDYLTKPFEGDELIIAVKRAIEHGRLLRENALLRSGGAPAQAAGTRIEDGRPHGMDRLVGSSGVMAVLREHLAAIAASQGTVLITGESGAGKEVVARAIHECSPRKDGPFLAVNCAALSESLLESELFGHEKGAFTGADRLRKGRFELADGGTLLLDEVSEVSPQIQAKLLRVLQERAFERVGSSLTIGVDVRVIATSNRDLPGEVAAGRFRQDLFYRLNVLPVAVPPVRDRPGDIAELADHFAGLIGRREGRASVRFSPAALTVMTSYPWPGNVRELQNICERAVVLSCSGGVGGRREEPAPIGPDLIEPWLRSAPAVAAMNQAQPIPRNGHTPGSPMIEAKPGGPVGVAAIGDQRTLEDIEREAILETLARFNGHRQRTALSLGIGVRTLGLKLKKWKQDRLIAETV
ncbi:MAG: sigma-54-dependent Fis family transcriptional regulator [Phycisphaerales bacterium]|nr:sigma-54-dependent Fis family transcriptional regulator [Phycisphaerales bacterium]